MLDKQDWNLSRRETTKVCLDICKQDQHEDSGYSFSFICVFINRFDVRRGNLTMMNDIRHREYVITSI